MGSSSSSRFDGWIPSSASSSRDRSPPDSERTSLNTSSPRNRNRARYARASPGRDGDRVEQRIEDGRARDRRAAQLGEVAELDGVARSVNDAVERRQVARDRAQQRGLAGAVRPDDADPVAALRGQERHARDDLRLRGGLAVRANGAAPRKVADGQVLDADDDLARPRGPAAGQRGVREGQPAAGPRRLAPVRLQPLEPGLVLVHLRELAVAAVALDELPLAGDLLGLGVGVLGRPGVALLALAVVRAVVAAERGQPAVAQLPDPGHGRVQEGAVVRRDDERAGPPPEVLLEPLERVEVEVVGRLVEQQQVRVGDDQPGQRRPRLLAARQRRSAAGPTRRGLKPSPLRAASTRWSSV